MARHNVNVVTKISTSSHLSQCMAYITRDTPHNSDHGQIKHRILDRDAIDCSLNEHIALRQFKHLQYLTDLKSKAPRHINSIVEIKSFSGLNYHSMNDRRTALRLNHEMMRIEHPHSQVFSILQADGKTKGFAGHKLHVHNIINPVNIMTSKSTTHNEADWERAVLLSNHIMKKNGYHVDFNAHPTIKVKKNGKKWYKFHGSSERYSLGALKAKSSHGWSQTGEFQKELMDATSHEDNLENVKTHLKAVYGTTLSCLRHQKINGKSVIKEYKIPGKNPKRAIKLHDGNYGRIRKTWLLIGNDGYSIRTSKLGTMFSVSNLTKRIHTPYKVLKRERMNNPHLYYMDYKDPNGIEVDIRKHGPFEYKHNRKNSLKIIREHYPHYPTLKPRRLPKPSKPHISTNGAIVKLMRALRMSVNTNEAQRKRQLAISEAMDNYAKEKQKKAIEYASWRDGNEYVENMNYDITMEVMREHGEINREIHELNRHPHRNIPPTF